MGETDDTLSYFVYQQYHSTLLVYLKTYIKKWNRAHLNAIKRTAVQGWFMNKEFVIQPFNNLKGVKDIFCYVFCLDRKICNFSSFDNA